MIYSEAWAAGLFDADGCFYIKRKYRDRDMPFRPCAVIAMTDEDTVRKFAKIVGGRVTGPRILPSGKGVWKVCIDTWVKFMALVQSFWPYLSSRRQERVTEIILKCDGVLP